MPIDPSVAIGADVGTTTFSLDRERRAALPPRHRRRAPARATTSTPTRCATPSTDRRCRCCRRSASWCRRSTRPTRRRSTCPGCDINLAQVVHGSQSISVTGPLPTSGTATLSTTLTDIWDKGKAAVIWQEGVATRAVRRGAVARPLLDLRQGRGRLGRRPRHVGAGRAPRPRARRRHVVRRDAAAGAALPALRRPQPAARRPRLRQGGRLPGADPARPVLLRHRAARAHRRACSAATPPGSAGSRRGSPASSSPARRSGCAAGARTAGSSGPRPSPTASARRARARRRRAHRCLTVSRPAARTGSRGCPPPAAATASTRSPRRPGRRPRAGTGLPAGARPP